MINEYLVGTWWIHKPKGNALYTYKGPSPPKFSSRESASFADDAESGWMDLNDPIDHCRRLRHKKEDPVIMITSVDFCSIVNIGLLNDMKPGDVKQIEIFPSGNWIMYD